MASFFKVIFTVKITFEIIRVIFTIYNLVKS